MRKHDTWTPCGVGEALVAAHLHSAEHVIGEDHTPVAVEGVPDLDHREQALDGCCRQQCVDEVGRA
jgi:hypothetical protein